MNHDPLCGLSEPCGEEEPGKGYCLIQRGRFCILCQQRCVCDRLAKARADEREKAAQRLEADLPHYEDCSLGAGARDCDCERRDAIDAVRGES